MLRTGPTLIPEGEGEMRNTGLFVVLCQQLWGCRGTGQSDCMGCAETWQTHATWGCLGCCFHSPVGRGSDLFCLRADVPCQAGEEREQRDGRGSRCGTPALLRPGAGPCPPGAGPAPAASSTGSAQPHRAGRCKPAWPCWQFLSPRY